MKRLGLGAGIVLTALLSVLLLSSFSASTAHAKTLDSSTSTLTGPVSGTTDDGSTFDGIFTVQNFVTQNDSILAVGTLNGTLKDAAGNVTQNVTDAPVSLPVTGGIPALPTTGATPAAVISCNVLNLVLGPLDLNLLGLVVHLNTVVLNITAQPGGLLGNLLCSLAGLNLGTPLSTITGLLNQILGAL